MSSRFLGAWCAMGVVVSAPAAAELNNAPDWAACDTRVLLNDVERVGVAVRAAPGADYQELGRLRSTVVHLDRVRGDWAHVDWAAERPSGLAGWVPLQALRIKLTEPYQVSGAGVYAQAWRDSPVVAQVGRVAQVSGCLDQWLQVKGPGHMDGWLPPWMQCANSDGTCAGVDAASFATDPQQPDPPPLARCDVEAWLRADEPNKWQLLAEPLYGAAVLDRLSDGDRVHMVEERAGWLRVDGARSEAMPTPIPRAGWLSPAGLRVVVPQAVTARGILLQRTPVDGVGGITEVNPGTYQAIACWGEWLAVKLLDGSEQQGWLDPGFTCGSPSLGCGVQVRWHPAEGETLSCDLRAVVLDPDPAGLKLWATPDSSGVVLATVYREEIVHATASRNGWLHLDWVQADAEGVKREIDAWAPGRQLGIGFRDADGVESVPVRAAPYSESRILDYLSNMPRILACNGAWLLVEGHRESTGKPAGWLAPWLQEAAIAWEALYDGG